MNYMDEKLNVRCFYLKMLKKTWVSLLFAGIGAVVFFVLYLIVTYFTRPHTVHADVQMYLHFVAEQSDDQVYKYYNAYTWKDLILSDLVQEFIMDTIENEDFREEALTPEERVWLETALREEDPILAGDRIKASLTVTVPADIRVLWVSVTDENPLYASAISKGVANGMIAFGLQHDIFEGIEIISLREPVPTSYPDRRGAAAGVGAVCGLILSFFYLWVRYLLSDAIYVPEEAERRYGLPVIGIMAPAGDDISAVPEIFTTEFRANLRHLLCKGRSWKIVTDLSKEGGDKIKIELEELRDRVSHALGETSESDPTIVVKGISKDSARIISIGEEMKEDEKMTQDIEQVVLVAVRAGVPQGVLIEHLIAQIRAGGEEPAGLLFMSTDMTFLRRYYRF